MARGHVGIPKPAPIKLSKTQLLQDLVVIDNDADARARVLAMETDFRTRIKVHLKGLPASDAILSKFNTNPFVLMFHSLNKGYKDISEIESDILPAKLFSSMETSAGRMVEVVVLPHYEWSAVPSGMHTANSILDGKAVRGDTLCLATLKSGPRCLNDEMSSNMADDILAGCEGWAKSENVTKIDFTYGVLYGTPNQSNKKDWHILRNIEQKIGTGKIVAAPHGAWACHFEKGGVSVKVTIRIGIDLWNYFGGQRTAFLEVSTALIRACIAPAPTSAANHAYTISDLADIISISQVAPAYNVSLLQRSQLEWLFFFARHFCDVLS
jgi:hypothetical protein